MLFSVALGEVIILAADLGAIAGVVALALTVISAVSVATIRWWRKRHPLKVLFSLDPYDAGAGEIQDRNYASFWETWRGTEKDALIRICPHAETTFQNIRLRLVERRWFSEFRLWRWIPVRRSKIRLTDVIDMRFSTSPYSVYYFEPDIEPPEGSFIARYFSAREGGARVSSGEGLWIGVIVDAWEEWRGRLEIDTVVGGKRIFERKRFHVADDAPTCKALFDLGLRTNKHLARQYLRREESKS